MNTRDGFTLIEAMVVTVLFTILFALLLTTLLNSDRAWQQGRNKLYEQQEARRAMDNIVPLLRQSNPQWLIDATPYPATISDNSQRIDFYQPVFDAQNQITNLEKVTFKLNPADLTQLLKKEGTADSTVVANNVQSITFGGGCAGCAAFNCAAVAQDCPIVTVDITTRRENPFTLSSQVTLRNGAITLEGGVSVEEPQEGEF